MKKQVIILVVLIAAVAGIYIFGGKLYRTEQAEKISFIAQQNFKTFVPDNAPIMGPDSAKVYLVEFLDPECEACRAFYPLVKQIMNEYQGKIKLVVRYAAFHSNSKFAISILEAARMQGRYWETLETLFKYQPDWGGHHNPQPEKIWDYLPEVGLDIDRIKEEMNSFHISGIIDQDTADGEALGVRQTPSFFVNGKPLQDFGYRQLKEMVDNEVKANYP